MKVSEMIRTLSIKSQPFGASQLMIRSYFFLIASQSIIERLVQDEVDFLSATDRSVVRAVVRARAAGLCHVHGTVPRTTCEADRHALRRRDAEGIDDVVAATTGTVTGRRVGVAGRVLGVDEVTILAADRNGIAA